MPGISVLVMHGESFAVLACLAFPDRLSEPDFLTNDSVRSFKANYLSEHARHGRGRSF